VENVTNPDTQIDTPLFPEPHHLGLVHGALYYLYVSGKGYSEKIKYQLVNWEGVKKNLQIPVSLITDESTVSWMKEDGTWDLSEKIFDKIILTERPKTENYRNLNDGNEHDNVPFVNSNRYSVWNLTPYDRTLLIDSDFLIFSDTLNQYWDVDSDILISTAINDIYDQKRLGYHDRYISDTGIHLYWATTVMFSKSEYSKTFFNLVDQIRENYQYYSDLFRFDSRQYRNDIAFSVAKHILDGYETDITLGLPPILSILDKDILLDVSTEGKLTMLISPNLDSNYIAASANNLDIHIMNKQSLIRQSDKLLELA
ncbi:hypothetical protein EBU71_20275, partial [bacterium]|nr:hypothetical protein [Candidatus Elulimicrobium humile]